MRFFLPACSLFLNSHAFLIVLRVLPTAILGIFQPLRHFYWENLNPEMRFCSQSAPEIDLQASFSADVSPEYGISSPDSPEASGGNPF